MKIADQIGVVRQPKPAPQRPQTGIRGGQSAKSRRIGAIGREMRPDSQGRKLLQRLARPGDPAIDERPHGEEFGLPGVEGRRVIRKTDHCLVRKEVSPKNEPAGPPGRVHDAASPRGGRPRDSSQSLPGPVQVFIQRPLDPLPAGEMHRPPCPGLAFQFESAASRLRSCAMRRWISLRYCRHIASPEGGSARTFCRTSL